MDKTLTPLKVPSAGESITEVMIVEWQKQEGEFVAEDEIIVEIETDKASMEVPAPVSGTLVKQHKAAGDTANVGEVIAEIEPGENDLQAAPNDKAAAKESQSNKSETDRQKSTDSNSAEAAIMPAAARLLAEHNLKAEEVTASGPGGRLLKEDVQRHLEAQKSASKPAAQPTAKAGTQPSSPGSREEDVVPMSMLRRKIAERLVHSQQTTASLTTFNECDMSAVMALRKEYQDSFTKKYGIKLGFMSFFVKAAIDALKAVPSVNAEIRGTDMIYKNYFDIGVAVGTDRGLVVPVIQNAERLSFAQVELTIADLAKRARERKLSLEELGGGTFTISNGGIYGSMLSTPILNPPQSGILGLHNIQERPIAINGQVEIRPMMYLALSYDHRIIDGQEAVTFLRRVKDCIEAPARMLVEV
jgi:2-oxoglutarate dehydrogenase E2 component (dihydrolipoamide succinyltransferase)